MSWISTWLDRQVARNNDATWASEDEQFASAFNLAINKIDPKNLLEFETNYRLSDQG